ncbi:MAG: hypothetical protein AABW91_03460 [Nanoarchaeota archaeon]
MHFYEASIITTKDGIHCQVYGNEHPRNSILVKPKYIPTDKIESDALQFRFISGRRMNRLNLWADKEQLKKYIESFKGNYPEYILKSNTHIGDRLFFSVPIDKIERIYFPKRGFSELMNIPDDHLDNHLKSIKDFGNFLLNSGLKIEDIGITYSTLMGHYLSDMSDINMVIYGNKNYWKLMKFLEIASHPLLKWKSKEDWIDFYKRRNRQNIFTLNEFLKVKMRKKSEGFFKGKLFVIFCAENEDEVWFKWGEEKYVDVGNVKIRAEVEDNFNSASRPGMYRIKNCKTMEGSSVDVKKVVFYSRDYSMIAYPGEMIEASGVLEQVFPKTGESYHRLVIGYFDSYITERREKEYLKVVE